MWGHLSTVAWLSSTRAPRLLPEPGPPPYAMHRGRCPQRREGRARSAAVATLAQRKAPEAWREAALAARAERRLRCKRGGRLALVGSRHGRMVGLGPRGKLPRGVGRRRPPLAGGPGTPGGLGQAEPHHRSTGPLGAWGPCEARRPWRPVGLVGGPLPPKSRSLNL